MRVIVCGGRKYNDDVKMRQVLDEYPIEVLINGQANGADLLSSAWAQRTGTTYAEVPALWTAFAKSAGPMRNRDMATKFGEIDLVIAFPGGAGTAAMIRIAESLGIDVEVIK
jgi:hypothetical protein